MATEGYVFAWRNTTSLKAFFVAAPLILRFGVWRPEREKSQLSVVIFDARDGNVC